MTSLGLASAISEFQTILSYQKKSVSKEGKDKTEHKEGRPGGCTCYACFWKEKHPVMVKCYHRNKARFWMCGCLTVTDDNFADLLVCFLWRCHHWMKFPFIIWNLTALSSFVAWFRICLTLSFTWAFMRRLTRTQKHGYVLLSSWDFLFIICNIIICNKFYLFWS